jgi:hypothetical protein
MSRVTYSRRECFVCGKEISASGGCVSHNRMHVRRGEMAEVHERVGGIHDCYSRTRFETTELGRQARKSRLENV